MTFKSISSKSTSTFIPSTLLHPSSFSSSSLSSSSSCPRWSIVNHTTIGPAVHHDHRPRRPRPRSHSRTDLQKQQYQPSTEIQSTCHHTTTTTTTTTAGNNSTLLASTVLASVLLALLPVSVNASLHTPNTLPPSTVDRTPSPQTHHHRDPSRRNTTEQGGDITSVMATSSPVLHVVADATTATATKRADTEETVATVVAYTDGEEEIGEGAPWMMINNTGGTRMDCMLRTDNDCVVRPFSVDDGEDNNVSCSTLSDINQILTTTTSSSTSSTSTSTSSQLHTISSPTPSSSSSSSSSSTSFFSRLLPLPFLLLLPFPRFARFGPLSRRLLVVLLSALPMLGLRTGIPVGFLLGLPPSSTFLFSLLGTLVPTISFLLLLRFGYIRLPRRAPAVLTGRARAVARRVSHGGRTVRKLMLFVGVPLPGSGAWTGALVAAVLGMPVRQGVQALCVGGVVAAGIVTAVCSMGWIGGVITGVVAIGVMMVRIVRGSREMKSGEKKKDNTMMIKKETMEAEKKEDGELVQVVKNEDCGQWEQNKKHGGDGASSSGKSSSSSNRNSKRSTVSAVLLTWLGMVDVN